MSEHFEFSEDLQKKLHRAFGKQQGQVKLAELESAALDFEASRYKDALKLLWDLMKESPRIPELLELHGLCHYRLGNYEEAIHSLEAFGYRTKSFEQYPVLADCYRAQQNYRKVSELWRKLKAANPPEELLTEGRIVFAGSLVDQGDFNSGAQVLKDEIGDETQLPNDATPKSITRSELLQVYALADIYDQCGDIPKAKVLFQWLSEKDLLEITDARERCELL